MNDQIQYTYIHTSLLGCVLFSVFEISKPTIGHNCSLVRKLQNHLWIEIISKIEVAPIILSLPSRFTNRGGQKLSDFPKNAFRSLLHP